MWDSINMYVQGTLSTLYMTFGAGIFGAALGIPFGFFIFITRRQQIMSNALANAILAGIVNIVRSIPFIIIVMCVAGFTRFLVGTRVGDTAMLVPLSIAVSALVARMVESALNEVPHGLIEASQAMGASHWQIIRKVLFPEALPGVVRAMTIALIALVDYSAMSGMLGGDGLGKIANYYGYQRGRADIIWICVIILVIIVQIIQFGGDRLARRHDHR